MNHQRTESLLPDTNDAAEVMHSQTLEMSDAEYIRVLTVEGEENCSCVDQTMGDDYVDLDAIGDSLVTMGVVTTCCSSTTHELQVKGH